MAVNFPPYYTSQILNADGKPVAGGLIRAYLTGTETPAPLFAPDGTPLGSSVSIDAAGNAVFCLRVGTTYRLRCIDAAGAVVWTRDGVRALGETAGIENPMTGAGDMIVGAAGGEPERLAPGAEGDALKIVSGVPTWAPDAEGMENPMQNPGDLIVGGTGGTATALPAGSDDQMLSPYTENGVKKLKWKNVPAQTGDHKVMVDGADGSPGYLLDKLTDGDNAHFSKSGNAVRLDTDNDKVAADNTDTAPGYLIDKLYPGNNVSIEAFLDGAVRKVKISATGGGGGGGSQTWFPSYNGWGYTDSTSWANNYNGRVYYGLLTPGADCTPKKAYAYCRGTSYIGGYTKNYVGIYERTNGSSYSLVCASDNLTGISVDSEFKVIEFNFSTTAKIYANKVYMFAWFSDKQWTFARTANYYIGGGQNKLYSGQFSASALPASFDANSGAVERYQPYFNILADL